MDRRPNWLAAGTKAGRSALITLDSSRPAGWLAPLYEHSYERVRARGDGEGRAMLSALKDAHTLQVRISDRLAVLFTHYPHAEEAARSLSARATTPDGPARAADHVLMEVGHGAESLRVVVRSLPYAPFQGILISAAAHRQEANVDLLAVAFAFSRALGSHYTGTFNVGGRTHDNFHAQFFKGGAPLWDALSSGAVTLGTEAEVLPGVRRSAVGGWPARCYAFRSPEPVPMALAVAAEASRRQEGGQSYDLTYRWQADELVTVLFPRAFSTEEEFGRYPQSRRELGKFGALELSGWILSVRDERVFTGLVSQPAELGIRCREALARMEKGWP